MNGDFTGPDGPIEEKSRSMIDNIAIAMVLVDENWNKPISKIEKESFEQLIQNMDFVTGLGLKWRAFGHWFIGKNYAGKHVILVKEFEHEGSKQLEAVERNHYYTMKRNGEAYFIDSIQPPHKSSSTGKISCYHIEMDTDGFREQWYPSVMDTDGFREQWYPSVMDMKFVELDKFVESYMEQNYQTIVDHICPICIHCDEPVYKDQDEYLEKNLKGDGPLHKSCENYEAYIDVT